MLAAKTQMAKCCISIQNKARNTLIRKTDLMQTVSRHDHDTAPTQHLWQSPLVG